MKYRIVSDSSCDILTLPGVDFVSVPLHIVTAEKDYADDAALDVPGMVAELRRYKGKTTTSCPNAQQWEDAFGDADAVFALTITSRLSGSYNAACCARDQYEQAYPGRHVFVIDSLSTGPELVLLLRHLRELVQEGLSFAEIAVRIKAYQQRTHLLFVLSSVQNLARNGRASKLEAEAVGLLGIRVLGRALDGRLDVVGKFRGEDAAVIKTVLQMNRMGWKGGKTVLTHCGNEAGAKKLRRALLEICPAAEIDILPTGGLCSFYAEAGGLLIGFEGADKEMTDA